LRESTKSKSKNRNANDIPKGIVICDCPLPDIAGADIELSDNRAIVVQCLSSWSEDNQNGNYEGNTASVQQGDRTFIRRLVLLAASDRYSVTRVILCLDVEISSALSGEIVTLQNAVIQQSGCPLSMSPLNMLRFELLLLQLLYDQLLCLLHNIAVF